MMLSSCSNGQEEVKSKSGNKVSDSLIIGNEIPKFDINFPTTDYKVNKQVTNSQEGLTVTNWLLEGEDENGPYMYFVAHNKSTNYLDDLITQDPDLLNTSLQAMLYGSAEKLGGFDFKYNTINYNGHPGMSSKCKVFNGKGIIKSKVYVINKDVFVVSGGGRGINEDELDAFLNSFQIIK